MTRSIRIGLAALILVVAPILLVQGLANARVASWAMGWNGFWLADFARVFVQVDGEVTDPSSRVSLQVNPIGRDAALRAFSTEPLASDALFVLAVAQRAKGNVENTQALLNVASDMDKRNRNLAALLLEQVGVAGDLDQTFAIVDRMAKVAPQLSTPFVRPLIQALGQEGVREAMLAELESGASWAPAFWANVPSDASRVSEMYELRRLTDIGTSKETDSQLLAALVTNKLFDQAFSMWAMVAEDVDQETYYSPNVEFAPLGWQLTSRGDRAMTFRGEGMFDIFVQAQTEGELARQLIRLDPGTYVLGGNIDSASGTDGIQAALYCASEDEADREFVPLAEGASWTVAGDCGAYWLVIRGSAWRSRSALRAQVSGLQFSQLN